MLPGKKGLVEYLLTGTLVYSPDWELYRVTQLLVIDPCYIHIHYLYILV